MHEQAKGGKFRVLVTTANGQQLLEHVDQSNVYWARNCSDFPWTVEGVGLLHIRASGRAVPLHVAWGRDNSGRELFRDNSAAALGCACVDAGARQRPLWTIFCRSLRCLLVGSWPIGWRSLCLGFRSSSRTRDGLPQAPAVAVVRLVHGHVCGAVGQCTALSKEASDEKPTPSRRKLRVFVRTGIHTLHVSRRST